MLGVLRLYGETALLAARRAARSWPVAFSLVLYAVIFLVATSLLRGTGLVGGIILGLLMAACLGSYLHLISHVVSGIRLRWTDLGASFRARLWDTVGVMFAFMIINLVLTYLILPGAGDKAPMVAALVALAMAVFFNPVPELIYQGTSRSFALLADSARFVSRHGIEWLIPNVLFAAALMAPLGLLQGHPGQVVLRFASLFNPADRGAIYGALAQAPIPLLLVMLAFVHWAMVFRGLLFKELVSGGPRRRAIRNVWGR